MWNVNSIVSKHYCSKHIIRELQHSPNGLLDRTLPTLISYAKLYFQVQLICSQCISVLFVCVLCELCELCVYYDNDDKYINIIRCACGIRPVSFLFYFFFSHNFSSLFLAMCFEAILQPAERYETTTKPILMMDLDAGCNVCTHRNMQWTTEPNEEKKCQSLLSSELSIQMIYGQYIKYVEFVSMAQHRTVIEPLCRSNTHRRRPPARHHRRSFEFFSSSSFSLINVHAQSDIIPKCVYSS